MASHPKPSVLAKMAALATPPVHTELNDADFQRALLDISRQTPRFLFRVWHASSGGDAALNSGITITPHAFRHGNGPKSLDQLDKAAIMNLWNGHVRDQHVETVFSSWSQSLAYTLAYADSYFDSYENVHVGVLDTSLLTESNPIFWTGSTTCREIGLIRMPLEFLAFGIISGPAYKAVKFNDIATQSLRSLIQATQLAIDDLPQETISSTPASVATERPLSSHAELDINVVAQTAKAFGSCFDVPIACYLSSMKAPYDQEEVGNIFDHLWDLYRDAEDIWRVTAGTMDLGGVNEEVEQAIGFLAKFAERKRNTNPLTDAMVSDASNADVHKNKDSQKSHPIVRTE